MSVRPDGQTQRVPHPESPPSFPSPPLESEEEVPSPLAALSEALPESPSLAARLSRFREEVLQEGGARRWLLAHAPGLASELEPPLELFVKELPETYIDLGKRCGTCWRCPPTGGACAGERYPDPGRLPKYDLQGVPYDDECERYQLWRITDLLVHAGCPEPYARPRLVPVEGDAEVFPSWSRHVQATPHPEGRFLFVRAPSIEAGHQVAALAARQYVARARADWKHRVWFRLAITLREQQSARYRGEVSDPFSQAQGAHVVAVASLEANPSDALAAPLQELLYQRLRGLTGPTILTYLDGKKQDDVVRRNAFLRRLPSSVLANACHADAIGGPQYWSIRILTSAEATSDGRTLP